MPSVFIGRHMKAIFFRQRNLPCSGKMGEFPCYHILDDSYTLRVEARANPHRMSCHFGSGYLQLCAFSMICDCVDL